MNRGRTRGLGWIVVACVLTWGVAARAGRAQEPEQECHCAGPDGDRIDDCTCLRMPRFDAMRMPFAPRPRLGLSVRADQGASVDALGARVAGVMEDGPAYEAGLREGDVITRLDGRSLQEPLEADAETDFDLDQSLPVQRLLAVARELRPGQRVELEYVRGDERQTVSVEARELPAGEPVPPFDVERLRADTDRIREYVREMQEGMRGSGVRGGERGDRRAGRLGIDLVELDEDLGEYFGTTRGVLVTAAEEESALGLRPGDVILLVDGREVTTPERVLSILGTYGAEEAVTFRVRRGGSEIDVSGRVGR